MQVQIALLCLAVLTNTADAGILMHPTRQGSDFGIPGRRAADRSGVMPDMRGVQDGVFGTDMQGGSSMDMGMLGTGTRDSGMMMDSGGHGAVGMDFGMAGGGVGDSNLLMDSRGGMDVGMMSDGTAGSNMIIDPGSQGNFGVTGTRTREARISADPGFQGTGSLSSGSSITGVSDMGGKGHSFPDMGIVDTGFVGTSGTGGQDVFPAMDSSIDLGAVDQGTQGGSSFDAGLGVSMGGQDQTFPDMGMTDPGFSSSSGFVRKDGTRPAMDVGGQASISSGAGMQDSVFPAMVPGGQPTVSSGTGVQDGVFPAMDTDGQASLSSGTGVQDGIFPAVDMGSQPSMSSSSGGQDGVFPAMDISGQASMSGSSGGKDGVFPAMDTGGQGDISSGSWVQDGVYPARDTGRQGGSGMQDGVFPSTDTGGQGPMSSKTGTREASAAADLLMGLTAATQDFDAAAGSAAPGAVESHAMVSGPQSQDIPAEPHSLSMPEVGGNVPSGSVVKTVTEEKTSFSMSGETSFEHFSSTGNVGPDSGAGVNLVDLNPVASGMGMAGTDTSGTDAGANLIERGRKDIPTESAAASAIDTSRTDAGVAGAERSAAGMIDLGRTGTGTLDSGMLGHMDAGVGRDLTGGTETNMIGGDGSSGAAMAGQEGAGIDMKTIGISNAGMHGDMNAGMGGDVIFGDGQTGANVGMDRTRAGAIDASMTSPGGASVDMKAARATDGGLQGNVDAGMGVDVPRTMDVTFGDGQTDANRGIDRTRARAIDLSMTGPGGASVDMKGARAMDGSVQGDIGTGMGVDTPSTMDVTFGDSLAGGPGGASVDMTGARAVDGGMQGDIGMGMGIDTPATMDVRFGDSLVGSNLGVDRTRAGAMDMSMVSPEGSSVEIKGARAADGGTHGNIDMGMGIDAPAAMDVRFGDSLVGSNVGVDRTRAGAMDVNMVSPGGADVEIKGARATDGGMHGDLGMGMSIDAPAAMDARLSDSLTGSNVGMDRTRGGAMDVNMISPGGASVDIKAARATDGSLQGNVDAGMGIDVPRTMDVTFGDGPTDANWGIDRTRARAIDLSMTGPGGASVDMKGARAMDGGVQADTGTGMGVDTPSTMDVTFGDSLAGGPGGASVDMTGARAVDGGLQGDIGMGMSIDTPATMDVRFGDSLAGSNVGMDRTRAGAMDVNMISPEGASVDIKAARAIDGGLQGNVDAGMGIDVPRTMDVTFGDGSTDANWGIDRTRARAIDLSMTGPGGASVDMKGARAMDGSVQGDRGTGMSVGAPGTLDVTFGDSLAGGPGGASVDMTGARAVDGGMQGDIGMGMGIDTPATMDVRFGDSLAGSNVGVDRRRAGAMDVNMISPGGASVDIKAARATDGGLQGNVDAGMGIDVPRTMDVTFGDGPTDANWGIDRTRASAIDLSMTGPGGASVDMKGARAMDGSVQGDRGTGMSVGAPSTLDVTFGDSLAGVPGGAGVDIIGVRSLDGGMQGDKGIGMGVDGPGMMDATFGDGQSGMSAIFEKTPAGAVDVSMAGQEGTNLDMKAAGIMQGDIGTRMGADSPGTMDIVFGERRSGPTAGMDKTRTSVMDLSMSGQEGASMDLKAAGAVDAGMHGDISNGMGVERPGTMNIVFGDRQSGPTDGMRKADAGTFDIGITGQGGSGSDIKATGAIDRSNKGGMGTGTGLEFPGTFDITFGDSQASTDSGIDQTRTGAIDLTMTGPEGANVDIKAARAMRRDTGVGVSKDTPGTMNIVFGDRQTGSKTGMDITRTGALDLSMAGQGGASLDVKTAGAVDTTIQGDTGAGMGINTPGSMNVAFGDRKTGPTIGMEKASVGDFGMQRDISTDMGTGTMDIAFGDGKAMDMGGIAAIGTTDIGAGMDTGTMDIAFGDRKAVTMPGMNMGGIDATGTVNTGASMGTGTIAIAFGDGKASTMTGMDMGSIDTIGRTDTGERFDAGARISDRRLTDRGTAGAERSTSGIVDISMRGQEGTSAEVKAAGTFDTSVTSSMGGSMDVGGSMVDTGSPGHMMNVITDSRARAGSAGVNLVPSRILDGSMTGEGRMEIDTSPMGVGDTKITRDVGVNVGPGGSRGADFGRPIVGADMSASGAVDMSMRGKGEFGTEADVPVDPRVLDALATVTGQMVGDRLGPDRSRIPSTRGTLSGSVVGDGTRSKVTGRRQDDSFPVNGPGTFSGVRQGEGMPSDVSANILDNQRVRGFPQATGGGTPGMSEIDTRDIGATGGLFGWSGTTDGAGSSVDGTFALDRSGDMSVRRGDIRGGTLSIGGIADGRVTLDRAGDISTGRGTGETSMLDDALITDIGSGPITDRSVTVDGTRRTLATGEKPGGTMAFDSSRDRSITGGGDAGMTFDWTGRTSITGERGGSTSAIGDVSITSGRDAAITLGGTGQSAMTNEQGGGILPISRTKDISIKGGGDTGMTLDGTGRMSMTGERRGGMTAIDGSRDRSMLFDRSGDTSLTAGGNTAMTLDGTGPISMTGEGGLGTVTSGDTSLTRGADAAMTIDRSGRVSMTDAGRGGNLAIDGTWDKSMSLDRSGGTSMTGGGGAVMTVDRTGGVSMTGGDQRGTMAFDGIGDISTTFDTSGTVSATASGGDAGMSREGAGLISVTGERRDGAMSIDGSGRTKWQDLGTGVLDGGNAGVVARDMSALRGRGTFEGRTVRQGEWAATWNYEGAVPKWFRYRVNPAPCRAYRCNFASCYVPNPHDCKSFIVCQRTALGTYVATRMRCAFGSYWTNSNIWTCERIDDINKEKFNCPNDPCRYSRMSRYPDEDFHNCRSYWECVNGRSVPKCCPAGQRFNRKTLSCVSDLYERCRESCPLQPDGCGVEGSKKEPMYDGNCRTFWDCGENRAPHPVCCPEGHSFEPGTDRCIKSGCKDACPREYSIDICGKISEGGKVAKSYDLKDDNCRTFMKCEHGESIAYCCRSHYFYNKKTGECEKILDPLHSCVSHSCPDGYKEECRYREVANPRKMYDIDAGIVRRCGIGTVFDKSVCTCNFPPKRLVQKCRKEVDLKFDHPEDRWEVKNYGDGFVSVFGDMIKNVTKKGRYFASLDGYSGMEVWRYDQTVFPEFTLKVTFKPGNGGGTQPQILVSNCQSTTIGGEPSFQVVLNPATSMITFTGRSNLATSIAELQYNRDDWNTYTLLFDGSDVLALIEDPNNLGKADSTSVRLKGELLRAMGPLMIGPCRYNSKQDEKGYYGIMSEVIFAKCLDKPSRNFMRRALRKSRAGPP